MSPSATGPVLKVSVLASGSLLLDGAATDLDRLAAALETAKSQNGTVFYYREAAAATPPVEAKAVLDLVVKNQLPISLSSKPDFSDYVDGKGVSHPRGGAAVFEQIFAQVRKIAVGETGTPGVVIVRKDRKPLIFSKLAESPQLNAQAAGLAKLVPPAVKRKIAVIATTSFAGEQTTPSIADASKAIPFLGNLMGFCYLGHAVWIFDGNGACLAAGCREADLLIVDSALLPALAPRWQDTASQVMRNANILVQDRASFQLRIVKKAGASRDSLDFSN